MSRIGMPRKGFSEMMQNARRIAYNENQKRAVPATLDEAKAAGLENEWWAAYCEARGG
jgi:hypothetical protein